MTSRIDRRRILRGGVAAALGAVGGSWTSGCGSYAPRGGENPAAPLGAPAATGMRILHAHFSRAGENYHYGGRTTLRVGHTEVLAGMISDRMVCDVHRIDAADPYPDEYDATVARNVREQDADARPAIANPLPDISGYDVVLLGSGLWNVRP